MSIFETQVRWLDKKAGVRWQVWSIFFPDSYREAFFGYFLVSRQKSINLNKLCISLYS